MPARAQISELRENGFCVMKAQLPAPSIDACRNAFWPLLLDYLKTHADAHNRGPHRHFIPMPFKPPCFAPEFFFDPGILGIVHGVMGQSVVADQWGCDVPVLGSRHQEPHVDYRRPLFEETPDLPLPFYMLVVSFGLTPITPAHGPIEIAPGTHRMPRDEALPAVKAGDIALRAMPLEIGDVLIRHPWAVHRGTPNLTDTPRALASIRYVRKWYADDSREADQLPSAVWRSLAPEQRVIMRFRLADEAGSHQQAGG